MVQYGHYLKLGSMDEYYVSELVSVEPNQIKARANTNVYLVIGLLIRWILILSSGKIKARESNSNKTSGHSESSSCWLLLLLKNISTWKADTVTTWLNNCINLSVHADSAGDVRLTLCRFSLLFSSLSWLLLSFAIDIFYLTIAVWVHIPSILELAGLQISNGFDISHRSDGAWPASFKTLNELNLNLHYNWSKFVKWQIWTYFHWTWFDSLNYIRELESPNLFIKTSIILIRELKTLNLFIKSLMILIRDFKFQNLIHWTCLNWT